MMETPQQTDETAPPVPSTVPNDQAVVPAPERNADGTFKTGVVANPEGKNGNRHKGYQAFGTRALKWLEEKSLGELEALVNDKAAMKKLSGYDALIIRRISSAISKGGDDILERLLNRIEGQAKATVDLNMSGQVGIKHGLDGDAKKLLESKLAGIAQRLGASGVLPKPDGG